MSAELMKTALLGTARTKLAPLNTEHPLQSVLAKPTPTHPAEAFWQQAALLLQWERVGKMPAFTPIPQSTPPAATDEWDLCSENTGIYLHHILDGKFIDLLPEFLTELEKVQKRIPPQYLPKLLNAGKKRPEWHSQITQSLGTRGKWLVAQNPDWQYASPMTNFEAQWHKAHNHQVHLNLFQQLRQQNPAQARAWLPQVLENYPTRIRGSLVQLLEHGLSLDDEPQLETFLDDKRHNIRSLALNFLTQLPDSQLRQRMTERARQIFDYDGKNLLVDVTALTNIDDSWRRDGVVASHKTVQTNTLNWRIIQLLTRVSLDFWLDLLGGSPAELIELVKDTEFERPLYQGWAKATILQSHAAWAWAILADVPLKHITAYRKELIAALPISDREEYAIGVLNDPKQHQILQTGHPIVATLNACQYPWSKDLARLATHHLAKRMEGDRRHFMPGQTFHKSLLSYAHYCPPSLAGEIAGILAPKPTTASGWQKLATAFIETIQFRHDMIAVIRGA